MGITAEIAEDWHAALAALSWQMDLGVSDFLVDDPVNRYDLPDTAPVIATARPRDVVADVALAPMAAPVSVSPETAVTTATALAAAAGDLDALRAALAGYDDCEIKQGARNLVFSDGNPLARVLILGEAPGFEEDREGRPFVGSAGQLLDRMFAAIGLDRASPDPATALYLTNVMPWRPPGDRDPELTEIAMMRPFVERHIALMNPEVIVVMGNTPLLALTGTKGILRARGTWLEHLGRPVLPMTHPADLLRNPEAKREAWADLLALKARLQG